MEQFTVEQFQENFDDLIEKVTQGNSFIINNDKGSVMLTPYKTHQNKDDIVEYFCDHNDGC